jgi:hypothetical protein
MTCIYCGRDDKGTVNTAASEAEIAALKAIAERLAGALKGVLEPMDGECELDHHGLCQTHFLESPCSVAEARALLAEYAKVKP